MPLNLHNTLIALEAILDAERELVLSGDLSDLQQLAEEKEILSSKLQHLRGDEAALVRVRQKADRNAALMKAAENGIKSAMTLIKSLGDEGCDLRTYTNAGSAVTMPASSNRKLEKKA